MQVTNEENKYFLILKHDSGLILNNANCVHNVITCET